MTLLHDVHAAPAGTVTDDSTPARRTRHGRTGRVDSERPNRSRAAQRAIDRRRKRIDADPDVAEHAGTRRRAAVPSGPRPSLRTRMRQVPFVVPVLALLVLGLGLSLWLSTKAAQDSYLLGIERKQNQALMDRRDSLKRTYESGDSAPELADKAGRQGLILAKDRAQMVVGADGKARIKGRPTPAEGTPIGTINPDTTPDPTTKIDTSKVDDSVGLPGGAQPGSPPAEATPPGTPPANPAAPQPGSTQPGSLPPGSPQPAPAPPGAAAPAPPPAMAPSPNVAPAPSAPGPNNGNPPGANSAERR